MELKRSEGDTLNHGGYEAVRSWIPDPEYLKCLFSILSPLLFLVIAPPFQERLKGWQNEAWQRIVGVSQTCWAKIKGCFRFGRDQEPNV